MPQLALDDIERHPLVGELDGVGVAQLVGREPPPHPGLWPRRAGSRARVASLAQGLAKGPSVDHAQQRPDGHAHAFEPMAVTAPLTLGRRHADGIRPISTSSGGVGNLGGPLRRTTLYLHPGDRHGQPTTLPDAIRPTNPRQPTPQARTASPLGLVGVAKDLRGGSGLLPAPTAAASPSGAEASPDSSRVESVHSTQVRWPAATSSRTSAAPAPRARASGQHRGAHSPTPYYRSLDALARSLREWARRALETPW